MPNLQKCSACSRSLPAGRTGLCERCDGQFTGKYPKAPTMTPARTLPIPTRQRRLQAVPAPVPAPETEQVAPSEAPEPPKVKVLSTNAKRAVRSLESALRALAQYDWDRLEQSGVRAVSGILERAVERLKTSPPQRRQTAKVRPGDRVRLNVKHPNAKRFDALLSDAERAAAWTVVDLRKATAVVEIEGHAKVFVPVRELTRIEGA